MRRLHTTPSSKIKKQYLLNNLFNNKKKTIRNKTKTVHK